MTARRAVALVLLAMAMPTQAAMICRWSDAGGRVHFADTVPDRYAQSARCTDSKQFDVPPEEAQQAQERARQLRQQADIANSSAPANPPIAAPRASAPSASTKRPAQGVNASTDCTLQRKLYRESMACFAPYRTVGGTKAEAFDKCRVIPAPEPKCGAVVN